MNRDQRHKALQINGDSQEWLSHGRWKTPGKEIDKRGKKLYGLMEEEIKIVEASVQ